MKLAKLIKKYALVIKEIIEDDESEYITGAYANSLGIVTNVQPNDYDISDIDIDSDSDDDFETFNFEPNNNQAFVDSKIHQRFFSASKKLSKIEFELLPYLSSLEALDANDISAFNEYFFYLCHSEYLLIKIFLEGIK